MKRYIFTALIMATNILSQAQSDFDSTVWNANTFDFWKGNWSLTWKNANGEEEHGVNLIESTLKDAVIQENFEAKEGSLKGYVGKSWTVWVPSTKSWKQTWVDNQGAYLDFDGALVDGNPVFHRSFTANGNTILQRMVFLDITEDGFRWDWENSTDGGKTWNLAWQINYKRSN